MVFARIAARRLSLPRQNLLRLSNVNPTSISGKAFNAARCLSTTGVRRAEIAGVTTMLEDKNMETGMDGPGGGMELGVGLGYMEDGLTWFCRSRRDVR